MSRVNLKPAAHRQTKYVPSQPFNNPTVLPLPEITSDIEQAKRDLSEYGMCLLENALNPELLERLRKKFDRQAKAEREAFNIKTKGKNVMGNMTNKGQVFLELIEHPVVDELCSYVLGRNFLLSSLTGHYYNGQSLTPQILHRDQGFVPATADFPAVCNMFWMLDDFKEENGGTHVVPGSHRWPAEFQIKAPSRDLVARLAAPAGTCFVWDGRVWHGAGVNTNGEPRRVIDTNFCLPWMRQQENWGITTLKEVFNEASDKVKARLGLFSYGTLGTFAGGVPAHVMEKDNENKGTMGGLFRNKKLAQLGNALVEIPEAVVGEDAKIHPMRRVTRDVVYDLNKKK